MSNRTRIISHGKMNFTQSAETFEKLTENLTEEKLRETLTLEECIHLITEAYHWGYDSESLTFDAWNQLLACWSVEGSSPVKQYIDKQPKENVNVNGNVNDNGGCKHRVYFELTQNKQRIINELTRCNYRTSIKQLVDYLTELFIEWESYPEHWQYIAQTYNPLAMNRTIKQIITYCNNGHKIMNPAGLFTLLIRKRKRRKSF